MDSEEIQSLIWQSIADRRRSTGEIQKCDGWARGSVPFYRIYRAVPVCLVIRPGQRDQK